MYLNTEIRYTLKIEHHDYFIKKNKAMHRQNLRIYQKI